MKNKEKTTGWSVADFSHGGCYRDRTCDLLYVKQVLSQLS